MDAEFQFIGWCSKDNHDKVWAVKQLDYGKYVTIWGRRGRTLQHKIIEKDKHKINSLIRNKESKGYVEVDIDELNSVYPEFETDLNQTTFWALLGG